MKFLKLFLLCSLCACGAKEAKVESKPFPKAESTSFDQASLEEGITLTNTSWFFWKTPRKVDEMKVAMQLGAKIDDLIDGIKTATGKKILIWGGMANYSLHLGMQTEKTKKEKELEGIEAELSAAREGDVNASRVNELEEKKKEISEKINTLEKEIIAFRASVLTQYDEDTLEKLNSEIRVYQAQAMHLKGQLAHVIDFVPSQPALTLKLVDGKLFAKLSGFGDDRFGLECSTTPVTLPDGKVIQPLIVNDFNLKEGKLQLVLAACKQREGLQSESGERDMYLLNLEKSDSPQRLLKGDLLRCKKGMPVPGKCLVDIDYGMVKYE